MGCEALVFGAPVGIISANLSTTAEVTRHEIGTPTGLECDCEMVLRSQKTITLNTDSLPDGNAVNVAAADFTFTGFAVLTSKETTWEREGFVTDSATYDIVTQPECGGVPSVPITTPLACPAGWGTLGDLMRATYSETHDVLKHERRVGDGTPGSPLLEVDAIYKLRVRKTVSATFETDKGWQGGDQVTINISSADGNRTISFTGIITSAENGKEKEGFETYNYTLESQEGCEA